MAQRLAERNYADVVIIDIVEGLPQGKALDLTHTSPLEGYDARVSGTNSWDDTAGSDVVVITSGMPRKPGMTREDLIKTNQEIVGGVAQNANRVSPNATFIVFANPMDAMCHVVKKSTGLPRQRVIGQGGILDSTRFRTYIALALGVSMKDVQGMVLGGHTDVTMVPMTRFASVSGIPLRDLLPAERLDEVVEKTRKGGTDVVSLLKTGSAFYAPSSATLQMIDAILFDRKRVLPCSVYLEGEYGIRDAFVGVPVKLGAGGAEEVLELKLTDDELAGLRKAADTVKELVAVM
jgi:malate dehydrogenase